jgi:tetratricopeptide (TPR) repeat protein
MSDEASGMNQSCAPTVVTTKLDWLRMLLFCGIIAGVVISSFISGVTGSFIFDDNIAIVYNESIQHTTLWQILKTQTDTPSADRPLTNLSYAIDYYLYGLNPRPYFWTNIWVQVIIAITLLVLLRRMLPLFIAPHVLSQAVCDWLALMLTLMWAIHPVQTECVLYITQRSEQFAMLSMVLAFYGLIRHHQSNNTQRRWLVLLCLSCTLGLLCKQNVAPVIVVLFLFDRALLTGSFVRTLQRRWQCYLLTLIITISILLPTLINNPTPMSTGTKLGVSSWEYLMTQSQVILWYLRNAFWPTGICLYYFWPIARNFHDVWLSFSVVSCLVVISLILVWKLPKIGTCLLSVFLILGPTSSVMPIVTEVATDRRVSMILPFLLFPAVILVFKTLNSMTSCKRRAAPITIALILIANLAMISLQTLPISVAYGNPVVLWTRTSAQSPHPQAAWEQLGEIYNAQGNLAPAWQCFHNCLQLEPGFVLARLNLGIVEKKLGHFELALKLFEAEATDPNHGGEAMQYMGLIYKDQKNFPAAIDCFKQLCDKFPDRYDYAVNLARVYNLTSLYAKARDLLQPFAKRKVWHEEIYQELGFSYSHLDELDKARQQYLRYLTFQPNDPTALNSLGVVMAKLGQINEAAQYFARALSVDPTLDEARQNLKLARDMLNPTKPQ